MQDYIYSALSSVAIAIHLIINYDLFSGRELKAENSRRYRGFLIGILVYYISDTAWGVLAGLGWTKMLYADTVVYFLALAAFNFKWEMFVVSHLRLEGWTARVLTWIGYMFVVGNAVMLAVNFFNDCYFYFDSQGNYVAGRWRFLVFIWLFCFNMLLAALAFAKAVASRGIPRRQNLLVSLFGITMTSAIAVQVAWPLLPFTALGCLIGTCFFHIFVVEEERDRLRQAVIEHDQAVKHMAELEKALERARAAEKARSRFFSIVSHDIRTPLNAILGYSELLQNGLADKPSRDEALKSIRASGTALLQLVNDVLDLSKMDSGKMSFVPVVVRLDKLTDEVFASFRLAASGKGLALVNKTADVPAVMLDDHRCRQILFNLIGNAVKFADKGEVTVFASHDGARLTLGVSDTGCGIAPDMQSRILDPFVQVIDPSHSLDRANGTGLGLSICKRLVDAMGGEIHVKSAVGEGSTFTIHVPCAAATETKAAVVEEPKRVEVQMTLPKRVLVVDDSAANRLVLKAHLKRAGVTSIDFACDGIEAFDALDAAAKADVPYDLVFSDFWMPNMNGMELVEKLRADPRFAGLSVYAVTADAEYQNDPRSNLFTGVLLKPMTFAVLISILNTRPKHCD